jgi:CheY-like chemotaxis protein
MDLLERAPLLEVLSRLTAEAGSGAGRLALVGGEAGIGKTTLVRRFTASLPTRVKALWGACDPLSLPRPLGPLVDVARGSGDALARLLDLESARPRLFAALRVRDFIRLVLDSAGFEVLTAADGRETLRAIEAVHPQLILLDLMMPVMSGWAVLDRLSSSAERPRVVVVSAITENEHAARLAGEDAYLAKPFRPAELIEQCWRLVGSHPQETAVYARLNTLETRLPVRT